MNFLFKIISVLATGDPHVGGDKPSRPYTPPRVTGSHQDSHGHTVFEIEAMNMQEASNMTNGTTVQGDMSRVVTRRGRGRYEISVREWNTSTDEITKPQKSIKRQS